MMGKTYTESAALNDGRKIPYLGYGTWQVEGEDCLRMIPAALEHGYRHIDTADVYGNQKEIGPGLKGMKRDELWVTSKLNLGQHSQQSAMETTDRILSELQLDYLDLLLIHWPDREIPFAETLGAMDEMRKAGKVLSIGVSNFNIHHLQDVLETKIPIQMNQCEFHPFLYQEELLGFCKQNKIQMTAYSPLGHGLVLKDPTLTKIGQKHDVGPGQVSLRWLYQHGLCFIPKTLHEPRLDENAKVFDFVLSPEEMAEIDALNANNRTCDPDCGDFDY